MTFTPGEAYSNAKDWLKFAEAKNAAAVALCAVILPFLVSAVGSKQVFYQFYGWVCLPFICLGLFLALLSFLPRLTKIPYLEMLPSPNESNSVDYRPSLIFFQDVKDISAEVFLERCREVHSGAAFSRIDEDFIVQVHSLAGITAKKMKLFSWSLRLVICGIFTPIAALALIVIWKNND